MIIMYLHSNRNPNEDIGSVFCPCELFSFPQCKEYIHESCLFSVSYFLYCLKSGLPLFGLQSKLQITGN